MRLRHLLILALILTVAAAVRWYKIGAPSFWPDELMSLEVSAGHGYEHLDQPHGVMLSPPPQETSLVHAAGSWNELFTSLKHGTHPPLYFVTLRLWRDLWVTQGDGDMPVRSLSLLMSLLAIGLMFDSVRVMHGSTSTGLWVAAILSLAGPQVQYAQEARGYAMLVAFMAGACDAIARLETRGISRPRIVGLMLSAIGMMLTHYMGFAVVAALALYVVIRFSDERRAAVMSAMAMATILTLLAWGPMLVAQLREMPQHLAWQNEPRGGAGQLVHTIDRLATLPLRFFIDAGGHAGAAGYAAGALLIVPALLLRRRPELLLWCVILWIVVGVVMIGDLIRSSHALELPRYTLSAATAAVVIAVLIFRSPAVARSIRLLGPAGLVASCAMALPLSYDRPRPDWRGMADYLDRTCGGDSEIVFYPNVEGEWYAGLLEVAASHYSARWNRPVALLTQPADATLLQRVKRDGGTIDVVSGSLPPDQIFPGCTIRQAVFFPMLGTCARIEFAGPAPILASAGRPADGSSVPANFSFVRLQSLLDSVACIGRQQIGRLHRAGVAPPLLLQPQHLSDQQQLPAVPPAQTTAGQVNH